MARIAPRPGGRTGKVTVLLAAALPALSLTACASGSGSAQADEKDRKSVV